MILVSACLCGIDCKYNGKNNENKVVLDYLKDKKYMIVCPEQLGGMTTPREPAEMILNKVINKKGNDVTCNFEKGARETLKIAQISGATKAILKEGSPSCGCNFIYDGNFNGTKKPGMGLTAKLLKENGIVIISENEI